MKRYVLSLLGLGLLGSPLLAQAPPAGAPVMLAPVDAGCANGYCPIKTKTVCVPEHYTKTTSKWVFSSGCESFCLCYYHGLFKGCGCDKGHCEHPYTRRYQVKKLRTCEKDALKCVPAEVPDTGRGHHHASCPAPGVGVPMAVVGMPATPTMPPAILVAPSPYNGGTMPGPAR